jgi:hypothetical protein
MSELFYVSSWIVKEQPRKVSTFLHARKILYDLNHHLLILILEKILLANIHIWPVQCVDLLKRIHMNFGLYFSEF